MIKKVLMLFPILSVFLTACSDSKLMNFTGKSENWLLNYQVNVLDEDTESTNLTIKYIGKNPTPREIHYVVEGVSGKSEGNVTLDNEDLKIGGHSCSGCAVTQEKEKIKANITWNHQSETLILKNH